MSIEILDPTSERMPAHRPAAPRLGDLRGVFGLVDISKPRGDVFLERINTLLEAEGVETARFDKPTHTRPAPVDLRREITLHSNAVIQALAD